MEELHPLRRLILKYCGCISDYQMSNKMAKVFVDMFKHTYSKNKYDDKIINLTSRFQGYLSRYLSGQKKPKSKMMFILSEAIGCRYKEIKQIYYSNRHTKTFNSNANPKFNHRLFKKLQNGLSAKDSEILNRYANMTTKELNKVDFSDKSFHEVFEVVAPFIIIMKDGKKMTLLEEFNNFANLLRAYGVLRRVAAEIQAKRDTL
jgi:hypothetical protein